MSININSLSPQELKALISQANKRRSLISKRKPATQARAAVAKLLKTHGWTFEELYGTGNGAGTSTAKRVVRSTGSTAKKAAGTGRGRKVSSTVAPKYRNPANHSETWTGRGKQPRWLAAETAKGRNLTEFLISQHEGQHAAPTSHG